MLLPASRIGQLAAGRVTGHADGWDAEADGDAADATVDLSYFAFDPGEADLEAVDLAEPLAIGVWGFPRSRHDIRLAGELAALPPQRPATHVETEHP